MAPWWMPSHQRSSRAALWHDDVGRVGGNGSRIALVRQTTVGPAIERARRHGCLQTGSGSSQPHPRRLIRIRPVPRPRTSARDDRLASSVAPRRRFPGRPHRFRPPRPRRPGDHAPASPWRAATCAPSPGGLTRMRCRPSALTPCFWLVTYHIAWNQRRNGFRCPRRSSPPSPMFDALHRDPAPSARRRFRSKTGIENLPANEHAQETPHTPSPTPRVEFSQGARVVDPAFGMGCRVAIPTY